jgi:demethylmenaquinone methyltransferase/2-methoxy-6-polyprenyl-1,4-benzoquinol methylase
MITGLKNSLSAIWFVHRSLSLAIQSDTLAKPMYAPPALTPLPPHPTLESYYGNAPMKHDFLQRIFDVAAPDYDHVERLLSLGSGRWYRRQALRRAGLEHGMKVLDVAVGTGLVAREEAALIGDSRLIVGLDPSYGMLRQAINSLKIAAVQGVGEQIPFADSQFDFLSMGYALRHLGDLRLAFAEFFRVLRPGGRLCILEITTPSHLWSRLLLRAYMRRVVPLLTRITTSRRSSQLLWEYYWDTIEACVSPQKVIRALQEANFIQVRQKVQLGIFTEYTAVAL